MSQVDTIRLHLSSGGQMVSLGISSYFSNYADITELSLLDAMYRFGYAWLLGLD